MYASDIPPTVWPAINFAFVSCARIRSQRCNRRPANARSRRSPEAPPACAVAGNAAPCGWRRNGARRCSRKCTPDWFFRSFLQMLADGLHGPVPQHGNARDAGLAAVGDERLILQVDLPICGQRPPRPGRADSSATEETWPSTGIAHAKQLRELRRRDRAPAP